MTPVSSREEARARSFGGVHLARNMVEAAKSGPCVIEVEVEVEVEAVPSM